MGMDNVIFLEVIEWFDETGKELVHRIPEKGSGEIKFGAQLTVRESQAAILFYKGRACDAFGPGRHTLKTANIPILTKILAIPWAMTSPLRAEVYMVNMKVFPNLKWGTREPVAFRDSELGLIRLRAHGVFNIQVIQPLLFINTMVGTMGQFTTEQIEEYLKRVIVSRFNDHLGEHLDSLLNLPGTYDELLKRASGSPEGRSEPLRSGPDSPLYHVHNTAARSAGNHRRQEPPEYHSRPGSPGKNEGSHGHGKSGRIPGGSRRRIGHGHGVHDARHVRRRFQAKGENCTT